MGENLARKIIKDHLVSGEMKPNEEIGIKIDQTLLQDATGTMAFLEYEAMGIPRVKTEKSVCYVDHNMLQIGFENADDHLFLQSSSAKYGVYFSKPGNGICHQVHLERFAAPGKTLLGSDSHTPTGGAMGMIAIGAGGLDVATAMAGGPYWLVMPKIVGVKLTGKLPPWVYGMDVILTMLQKYTVKGGVNKIFEYYGPGVASIPLVERAAITNMGAELGATTSIFPTDEETKAYLKAQGREDVYKKLEADKDATYDEYFELNLSNIEPMIALPHSPDNVRKVSEVSGTKVAQVAIGSCTNSSFYEMMLVAKLLKGKKVNKNVSLVITPGSRQVLSMLASNGALADMLDAGARVLETACGPCIGMGQAPPSNSISLRTYNRNFEGRNGTPTAKVYLASPAVAVAAALAGEIVDPRTLGEPSKVRLPSKFLYDDSMILPPSENGEVEIIRGPNIKPLTIPKPPEQTISGEVLLKVGDDITTDHILPGGAKVLPLRSNIPAISEFTFERIDPTFPKRAKEKNGGFVVGGLNYGQGSSREHAAIAPMYLGVKAIIAKTFARIHKSNLINFGIIPLTFQDQKDYDDIAQGDSLTLQNVLESLSKNEPIKCFNKQKNKEIVLNYSLTQREREILIDGGLLNHTKKKNM
ncbi:MAG: aconitate hydratase [Thermoplasmata archaeon]